MRTCNTIPNSVGCAKHLTLQHQIDVGLCDRGGFCCGQIAWRSRLPEILVYALLTYPINAGTFCFVICEKGVCQLYHGRETVTDIYCVKIPLQGTRGRKGLVCLQSLCHAFK